MGSEMEDISRRLLLLGFISTVLFLALEMLPILTTRLY